MILNEEYAQQLWERAFASELGISMTVEEIDKRTATNILYRARQALNKPELNDISIVTPGPHPNQIWLHKKMVTL